jgi:hypothetical protein
MSRINVGFFVGLDVGKSSLPDMARHSGVYHLDLNCRECRVFPKEDTPGENVLEIWS